MDNKTTNDKLKKLVEEVSNLNPTDFCNVMHSFTQDIINRLQTELKVCNEALDNSMKLNSQLQAENEQLIKDKENLAYSLANAVGQKMTAKAKAYKEFAELSIKKICEEVSAPTPSESYIVEKCNQTIDNLLKELEG